jgi:Uncharacterized iron-regulated membrane protein
MRTLLTRLHRYVGLGIAIFLVISGLTGSLIVFHDELDAALNPELFAVPVRSSALTPSALARSVEHQLGGARVTMLSLNQPKGRAAEIWVEGHMLPYNQVFADPATGRVLGKRQWGEFAFSRAAVMPFIYSLHYTLALPGRWGVLLMGVIACLWSIDCFTAFILTLPRGMPFWRKWKTSWSIKRGAGPYRLNFDLHRAGGLWLWAILLILATSGVAMNLPDQVFRPILKLITPLEPSLTETGASRLTIKPAPPAFGFDDALTRAKAAAPEKAVTPYWLFHFPAYHAYGLGYSAKPQGGMDGMGLTYIYIDDRSGASVVRLAPKEGRAADVYAKAQFQLHSGRILGWPGRILVFLTGIGVAGLSVTGVVIWWKKAKARRKAKPARPARLVPALRRRSVVFKAWLEGR